MLNCKAFYNYLKDQGIYLTTGVPDSLLKDFCAYAYDHGRDIIAANEGAAIGLAAGHYLATGQIPLVYMQNSGFGNAINPITSLIDPEVYAIPMLIMIGWRGEPGVKDEPQHIKQGRVNEALLKGLELPYAILADDYNTATTQVDAAFEYMRTTRSPYVLLVRKNTFESYKIKSASDSHFEMNREDAIREILPFLSDEDILVSTTGKSSREVFEYRAAKGEPHDRDFLTVGCMGHASQIALGIALEKPHRNVFCLDGDGAVLMHMGSLAIIGGQAGDNFRHILINNGSHDSVGGQATVAYEVDFEKIVIGSGYRSYKSVDTKSDLRKAMQSFVSEPGPSFLEVKTKAGARTDLGRPTIKPVDNKVDFMKNLSR
ncbi:MAG: phosphonopyruvate decarboxylase [Cyclobacteriaceae bacterium]